MLSWAIAVHQSNGRSYSVECSDPHFIVGTEVADGLFTVQGDGILSRHLRVTLGEESVTLEPLANAELTEVQGVAVSRATTAEYPVRIRVGSVEMLIDRVFGGSESSTSLESIPMGKRDRIGFSAEQKPILPVANSAALPEKTIESTIAFSMDLEEAPVEEAVPVQKSYALKKEIARGGMGRIFLADDVNLERQVAVKVSHSGESSDQSAFYREARILAHLSHPNIVPVHNFGRDSNGRPFYSMKLVQGQTLQAVLKRLRIRDAVTTLDFTLQRLLNIFRRVCHGVEFAHSSGYLHRDLKPENIMIGDHGEVLVMDWGLAQPLTVDAEEKVASVSEGEGKRVVEGTPQYMSPEQASSEPLDERSDIYSLGAILYAILTLRAPIQGKSVEEILTKVRSGRILPLEAPSSKARAPGLNANTKQRVPKALEAIVSKAMRLDRSKRYKQVTELIRDIEAYQGGFPTSAENAGTLRQFGLLVRRHRTLAVVLLMSLVGAATSAVRLARSERNARAEAVRAEENARRAEQSAIEARQQERAAVEAHRASRVAMAEAMMASASVAETELDPKALKNALDNVEPEYRSQIWEYQNKRLDSAGLTINAPNQTTFKSVFTYRDKKSELIVLLSDGSIQLVNWISGAFTMLGKIDPGGFPSWPTAVPSFAIANGSPSIAFIRNFAAPEAEANCQLEIRDLASGAPVMELPLTLGQRFLKKHQLQFNATNELLLVSSPEEPKFLLVDVKNQKIKWQYNAPGFVCATFTDAALSEEQSVRVYSSKEVIDLDPATKAIRQTLPIPNKSIPLTLKKLILKSDGGGYFAATSSGWLHFDSEAARVMKSQSVPLGVTDIAYTPSQNTVITASPQAAGYGVIQFWNAGDGELVHSEMVLMDKRSGKSWMLTTRPDSNRVALTSGSQMKVWALMPPEYVKSFRSERVKDGMDGQNFAFFDQPWHAFRVVQGADGANQMDGMDLRQREAPEVAYHSAPVPVTKGVPSASLNGRFVAWLEPTTQRLAVYESRNGGFDEVHSFENFDLAPLHAPSPDGMSVWLGRNFFTFAINPHFIRLNRQRYATEESLESSAAWVGNKRVVEIVNTVAQNETDPAPQKMLVLWSTEQTKCVSEIVAPEANAVCASPDGAHIAEAGDDMKVRTRNGSTLAIERELRVHDGPVKCIAWNPRLPLLATTSLDHTLKIWDLRTEKQVASYSLAAGIPDKICWSPDGSALALAFPRENKHEVRILLPAVCRQQP